MQGASPGRGSDWPGRRSGLAPDITLAALSSAISMGLKPVVIVALGITWGPAEAGQFAVAYGWAGVCAVLFFLAMGTIVLEPRFASMVLDSRPKVLGVFAAFLGAGLVISLGVTWALFAMEAPIFQGVPMVDVGLALASVLPLAAEPYALGLHQVRGDVRSYNRVLVTAKLGFLVFLAVGLTLGVKSRLVLAALSVTNVAVFVLLCRASLARGQAVRPTGPLMRAFARRAVWWVPQQVGAIVIAQSYVFFLNASEGETVAGLFAVASQLALAGLVLPIAIAMISSSRSANPTSPDSWGAFRRFVVPTIVSSVAIALLLPTGFQLAYAWLPSTQPLDGVSTLLGVLCVGVPAQALSSLMVNQWVIRGRTRALGALSLVQALGTLALLAPLVGQLGGLGAAFACTISNLVVAACHVIAFWRWDSQWFSRRAALGDT